jgi:hypothetical protein
MHRVPAQRLPRNIRTMAKTRQLGALQRIYQQGMSAWWYILFALGCIGIGAGLISVFILFNSTTFIWWPIWQAHFVPVIGVCWILLGCWLALNPLLAPAIRVYIYARGIIYQRRRAAPTYWRQVAYFWRSYPIQRGQRLINYRLECDSGLHFVISSHLAELELLGQFLDKVVTRRWLPIYIAVYHRDQPLDFNLLEIDSQGIRIKQQNRLLEWAEVDSLELDKMYLTVHKKDEEVAWATLPIGDIPNATALKRLVSYICQDMVRLQLPEIVTYQRGASVHFGKLSLSKQGIELHDRQEYMPWDAIAGIGVGEDEVIIRKRGVPSEWYAVPLWSVTNVAALRVLISHIVLRLPDYALS